MPNSLPIPPSIRGPPTTSRNSNPQPITATQAAADSVRNHGLLGIAVRYRALTLLPLRRGVGSSMPKKEAACLTNHF